MENGSLATLMPKKNQAWVAMKRMTSNPAATK